MLYNDKKTSTFHCIVTFGYEWSYLSWRKGNLNLLPKLCLLFLRRIQSTLYCGNSLGKGSVHQNRSPSWILRIWKWKCLYSAFYCHVHLIDPLVRFSPRVAMSVCLSVCLSVPSPNTHFRVLWRLLVKERIPNIGLWWHNKKNKTIKISQDCKNARFWTSQL